MNKLIPINSATTDSIKIYLPIDKITIIDKTLVLEYYKYYQGEQYPEATPHKAEQIEIIKNGYKMRIGIKAINMGGINKQFSKPVKCLSTVITSKILKEKYFQGITQHNLKEVYNELMKLNIFRCSFDAFKNAKYSDHDICENRYTNTPEAFNDIIKSLINQSGTKSTLFNHFNQIPKKNLGLDINTRIKGTPSQPYIKFYHKEFELTSEKNYDFYQEYIKPNYSESLKNLVRVEGTIKNSAHRKRLIKKGVISEYKTLGEVLTMPQTEQHKFLTSSLNEYIIKIKRKTSVNLSPTEHILFEMIQNQITLGMSFEQMIKIKDSYKGNNTEHTNKSKTRIKKQITKIHNLIIHDNQQLKTKSIQNTETNIFLKSFGIALI